MKARRHILAVAALGLMFAITSGLAHGLRAGDQAVAGSSAAPPPDLHLAGRDRWQPEAVAVQGSYAYVSPARA